eukprot:CAMPEP_0175328860 /NCGR_PEP_ID=MMETSP0093-20121207/75765_1 /TAXON_ID=311494 /ORGANISM="Alexandrium monilatum, Strain CCMP3105" /LENGTH=542 /DNA_ID=CAMNT_0016625907 /DNA_START=166 /DNA_END=1792 /DNA_ORIENTATION=+
MRAARIAKLGARAGRFTRLAKLLRFLPFMPDTQASNQGTAKVISARLITSLSMRVSCLIIVMVIVMPVVSMWTYPLQDWSMSSWLGILDAASSQFPDSFDEQLRAALGAGARSTEARRQLRPSRGPQSRLRVQLQEAQPDRLPDEHAPAGRHHGADGGNALNLRLRAGPPAVGEAAAPGEEDGVEDLPVRDRHGGDDEVPEEDEADEEPDAEEEAAADFGNETQLLERVVVKLAVLSEIATSKSALDPEAMEDLGAADRAVIHGYQGQGQDVTIIENAGLSLELIDSDNLNPLELDKARNRAAATYFLSQLHHGMALDAVVLQQFVEAVEAGYLKTSPYHNWYHAVDVAHCVHRILRLCGTEHYLSSTERFGILVSSVCHDIGHPGLNNMYLVETAHELALRYNDKSPLENMHCARLFELVSAAKCNIFALMPKHQYQEVRRVCVEVILHTDNAQHFAMIKEVQMLYEVHSEMFALLREKNKYISAFTLTTDALEHLSQQDSRKLMAKLFLHFSDISNCMKPFRICEIWAMKIMEEFFMQGD